MKGTSGQCFEINVMLKSNIKYKLFTKSNFYANYGVKPVNLFEQTFSINEPKRLHLGGKQLPPLVACGLTFPNQ